METTKFHNHQNDTEEEESLLLKRLIALQKQLEDDKPKIQKAINGSKENVIISKNIISSKFKYCKINNNANKFISTKLQDHNFLNNQNKKKSNILFTKTNNLSSKVYVKPNLVHSEPIKTVINTKSIELLNGCQNSIEKYNLEINEIMKNSHVDNCKVLFSENSIKTLNVSQTLFTIDEYLNNVKDYLKSSNFTVDNKNMEPLLTNNQISNPKNVHVNRNFQKQLISNNLLRSNLKNSSNALMSIKKTTIFNKKKPLKKFSGKMVEVPALVKIGNTKLIRQSLFKSKWKINNKLNSIENGAIERKPLSTLQTSTSNSLITSCNKSKWTKVDNPALLPESKLCNTSNANKLKWTRPNILLVDNVNKSSCSAIPKTDKLILFGKNKIIRQSLISSTQSKTKKYLLKHLSHRFALMRKLQQKNNVPKVKYTNKTNEQIKNMLLLKKIVNEPVGIKNIRSKSNSMYSYVNPIRLKMNNNLSTNKSKSLNIKIPSSVANSNNKLKLNLKLVNTNENLTLNKAPEQLRSKKSLTKQLCLVFNRFGFCTKLGQGKCDKRHYKKFITLCTKFLTGECHKDNCKLSHNIVEEKVPFCKHYLNSVCVQLNCPFLHEYRNSSSPVCTNFLHGYCTLGKKCPKKHLNLCPIFETKNKCPHGSNCLYPHVQCEEKQISENGINEPRYFELSIPNNEGFNENELNHIVPKRRAPLTDLPSFIPLT